MAAPTIPNGEEYFFPIIYEGNGGGQRVGKFVPFTDNGTIDNSCMFNDGDSASLSKTAGGSPTSTRQFTISLWVKRGVLGSDKSLITLSTLSGSTLNPVLQFTSSNQIQWVTSGGSAVNKVSNRTFEDTSKWYHILVSIDTTQSTADNRNRIYVDGDEITSWATNTNPSQNADYVLASGLQTIGNLSGGSQYFDGYLAEVNYVDGTALTPSTFGVTDTSTGRWIPKTLSGITYGTNGFRLTFADSSALGDDTSGNTNDFSVTNLVAGDQTTDSPTQNHSTFSPNADETTSSTLSEGNLKTTQSSYGSTITTLALPSTGKYYWEFKATSTMDGNTILGVQPQNGIGFSSSGQFPGGSNNPNSFGFAPAQTSDAQTVHNSVFENCPTLSKTTASGTYIQMCWDGDTGSLWFGLDNTFEGNPSAGTGASFTGINSNLKLLPAVFSNGGSYEVNFGQRSFQYTPPTGFVALQQDNLPETAKGITGLSWIKDRDTASHHALQDSSRGATNMLYSNLTTQQTSVINGVQRFLKGGIAINDDVNINASGKSIVAWNWVANGGTTETNTDGNTTVTLQKNTTAGFSIGTFKSTSASQTLGHGLGVAPEVIILKCTSTTQNWFVYHKQIDLTDAHYLHLNTTDAEQTGSDFGNTLPTSTVFTANPTGVADRDYCFWAWTSIEGYSKFGRYTGNNSTDGPFVYTGFAPAFVMIKRIGGADDWYIVDSTREPHNPKSRYLEPNTTNAEASLGAMDFLSNGFKLRMSSSGFGNLADSYIYMAFAEHPFVGDGTNPVTAR